MSQENVELVRKSFAAYNSEGIEALLLLHAPDTVWYALPDWLEDPVYRGHDGARKLSAAFTDNFDNVVFELHDIRDAGSRVVAHAVMTGETKNSAVSPRQPIGIVFSDFRDGMIGEVRYFPSWQQALKAVGLAEQDDA
jgi:ketosteroid isomerase-like protein